MPFIEIDNAYVGIIPRMLEPVFSLEEKAQAKLEIEIEKVFLKREKAYADSNKTFKELNLKYKHNKFQTAFFKVRSELRGKVGWIEGYK